MKFTNIDEIDQKILQLLSENARMSYVEIGEKVNLSRVAVKHRIKGLEDSGVIEKYSIIVNPEKVGRSVSAYFDIEVEPSYLYEVANTLKEKEYITDIYLMTGSSKLHVHAILELNEHLEKLMKDELYPLPGIKKLESSMILSRIKVRKGIRL
ncbi:Lrp/AsnC family transcriptional regulator [Natranaerobius trueperi]|uniref:AsnC family transcriptional regulator n=1 Tax=Natranaerobius trueperi TaxID=759412 RepID=A0A226C143_9FIRM|nr:Lrp/AsnC family transcriptional regulator [Natranaerobius trueperi]OWZ85008.1 AsnC family transcriptional regulator [Natranaerobius trueperi]